MNLYHIKIATASNRFSYYQHGTPDALTAIKLARNLYPLATKITVELINKPEAA